MTPAEKRVIKGAAFFDAVLPGWVDHIDIDSLLISSTRQCVASQLVTHLSAAYPDMNIRPLPTHYSPWQSFQIAYPRLCARLDLEEKDLAKLGLVAGDYAYSRDLTRAWKTYIRTRLATARVISDDFTSAMPQPNSVTIICGANETVSFPTDVYTVIIDGVRKYATLDGTLELVHDNAGSVANITIEAPK